MLSVAFPCVWHFSKPRKKLPRALGTWGSLSSLHLPEAYEYVIAHVPRRSSLSRKIVTKFVGKIISRLSSGFSKTYSVPNSSKQGGSVCMKASRAAASESYV